MRLVAAKATTPPPRLRIAEILVSAVVSALTAFPLSIGFALLAGVPPATMVVASVYSALFNAALAGRYGVGGPNTAVAMLTGTALMPYAPAESSLYMGYVFALCVLVGVYQLLFALILRKIDLMDYVSATVIDGITFGIGAVFVLTSLWLAFGLAQPGGAQWTVFHALMSVDRILTGDGNLAALAVAGVTIAVGIVSWQFKAMKRYAILVGLVAGFLAAQWAGRDAGLEYVGWLSLPLFTTSLPDFRQVSWPVIFALAGGPAMAIALVGTLQTLSIAKSIRDPDEAYRPAREMLSQGLQHVFMGFFSGAPVSNSFNKSALKRDLGGGRSSQALSAVVTVAMIFLAGGVVAGIPMSALGGALILVGMGMLNLRKYRHHLSSGVTSATLFFLPAVLVVVLDIQSALLIGFGLSLLVHFWTAARPNVRVEEHVARDGRHVSVVTIDGNLFFGSLRYVERVLAEVGDATERNIVLLRTDHLTYLDVPGARLLADEAARRRRRGDALYVYAVRKTVIDVMRKADALKAFGEENVIHRDLDHPMKALLYPFGPRQEQAGASETAPEPSLQPNESPMDTQDLARRLHATTVFCHVPTDELAALIAQAPVHSVEAGTEIVDMEHGPADPLVLLSGELAVSRTWTTQDGVEKFYQWRIEARPGGPGFALLDACTRGIRARALTGARYLRISGDVVDDMLGWAQLSERLLPARQLKVLRNLPLENVEKALDRMVAVDVEAGQTIVTQGEPGDRYYLIVSGEAEVWQVDPLTDETRFLRVLGDGDAFGEEALLQSGYRTATVKMTVPGRLLSLAKGDFDELLKPVMSQDISAEAAKAMLDRGESLLLDCRYDLEYEEGRIPGALLVPLDRLRQDVATLDPDQTYIVYCRSGRRSKAGAFLLRERGVKAFSLTGGIKAWPYEVELPEA